MNKGFEKVKDKLINAALLKQALAMVKYNNNPKMCLFCNKIIPYEKRHSGNKYCNHSCAASITNKNRKTILNCINCNSKISNYGKKYCNSFCRKEYQYKNYINLWLDNKKDGIIGVDAVSPYIRRYFFEKYNNKCQQCNWGEKNIVTNNIPLTLDHINGNCLDNKIENLRLLCPNCHSLTSTYGALNKGKGRTFRKYKRNNTAIQDH